MRQYAFNKVDYYDSFSDFIRGIEMYSKRPAIEWFDRTRKKYSKDYTALCGDVCSLKNALISKGMAGKHIAIVSENCYNWILAFLAITASGGVAVCVDTEQSEATIRELITQADAEMVFVSDTFRPICAPLLSQGMVAELVLMEKDPEAAFYCVEDLLKFGSEMGGGREVAINGDDTAAIIFTSGTTSKSKPVMLSHRNLLHNASNSVAAVDIKCNTFTALPFYHSYGLTCAVLNGLIKGSRITINGNIKTMMRDLLLSESETFMAVPLLAETLNRMLWAGIEKSGEAENVRRLIKRNRQCKKFGISYAEATLRSIKEKILGPIVLVITGGAHLNPELGRSLQPFGILVLEGYGITECSPLIAVNRNEFYGFGTVGPILPGCEVKIVEGEIWVRGSSVMRGYYKNPEATSEVLEGEWFKTGDLGSFDGKGLLTITGRIKNLIVLNNGKKISPEKIEELILRIPLVKDVMVYGVGAGDDVKPAASIFPEPELTQGMSSYEILEQLQKEVNKINLSLPTYQQIQMVNIRDKEFSKTSTRKIKRY